MYVCDLICPEPAPNSFMFTPSLEAALHNSAIFTAFNNNLGGVSQAFSGSTLSYMSEFRPPEQQHQIWAGHPSWHKFHDTLSNDRLYPLTGTHKPADHAANLAHLHGYGNHKSATSFRTAVPIMTTNTMVDHLACR